MKNQSDTFANSAPSGLQVERKVETSISTPANHLDTKFTADEVYSAVWVLMIVKKFRVLVFNPLVSPFVHNEYFTSCSSLSFLDPIAYENKFE